MKQVLSLLMCFVLMHSQAFALAGGPTYGSFVSLQGTYSGVMIPTFKTTFQENPVIDDSLLNDTVNSLGIFALGIPESGASIGNFLYFDEGQAFYGTISAAADPDSAELKGILVGIPIELSPTRSAFLTEEGDDDVNQLYVPENAVGKIEAKVVSGGLNAGNRIVGTAYIQNQAPFPNNTTGVQKTITFEVDGFQQTLTADGATVPRPTISAQ